MTWKSLTATMTVLLVVSIDLTSSHDSTEIEAPLGQSDHNESVHLGHRTVGDTELQPSNKIVGGTNAKISDIPWQVLLLDREEPMCGGSIVSELWVVTAAHCLRVDEVVAGTENAYSGGDVHKVVKQRKHPKYTTRKDDYDIAVIKVDKPFKYGTKIQPVEKLASEEPAAGTRVTVSGWGKTSDKGNRYPNHLKKVTVAVVERSKCKEAYGRDFTKRMICAASKGKDACEGDSGGPLVKEKTSELVGIVSFGEECGSSEYPGVYTSVAAFKRWIEREIRR